jgi:hypothetical protein
MENGELKMGNGVNRELKMGNGVNRELRMENGEWRMGETDPHIKREFHDFVGATLVVAPV